MNILVSGASGMIGRKICTFLSHQGHAIIPLKRGHVSASAFWDIDKQRVHIDDNLHIDIIIHLAGESIAGGRWTREKKARIKESRVVGTQLLSSYFAKTAYRPRLFICGSAVGFYGDQGNLTLTESNSGGDGFLADVCQQWEAATETAAQAGIRVVNLRFGMVLSDTGGALQKMVLPFSMGLGGVIGSGQQYISWISINDVVRAVDHIIAKKNLTGPVNCVSPSPVTNAEFTRTLGRILKRPTVFPLPAFAAKLLFGEMAQELFLSSTRVVPAKLQKSDFCFKEPTLQEALHRLLR